MKNILFTFIAILLFNTLSVSESYALRCGQEIVGRLNSQSEVLSRCGQPGRKEVAVEFVYDRNLPVEKWFYNCGDQDFVYVLYLYGLKVVKEDILERGSGPSECRGAGR